MIIGFDASRAFVAERSGTENYSYQLLKAMLDFDEKFLVYTRGDVSLGEEFKRENLSFKPISWPRLWTQGGLAMATWQDKLDLLFVPAHTLPVLARPGLPTVVTIHGVEYEYLPEHYKFPQKLYLTWSTKYAIRHATRIIAVSQFTANQLVERFGASQEKVTVVHEGVDVEVFAKEYSQEEKSRVLRELGINKPFILFVGVVQPRKNLERLVEAFSYLVKGKFQAQQARGKTVISDARSTARSYDLKDFNLVIAGKLGWMYGKILEAPKKHGIGERVKFVGFVEDSNLLILMQEAEILVQPSLTEGFGLPVLEAMAAGTPVVAANAGALPEILGFAGYLVNPESTLNITNGLAQVLTDQGLRDQLRERGLLRCKNFSWEKTARATVEVLKEAVGL